VGVLAITSVIRICTTNVDDRPAEEQALAGSAPSTSIDGPSTSSATPAPRRRPLRHFDNASTSDMHKLSIGFNLIFYVFVRNRMLVSLRGGGGELGNLKT
jgi:hypothetical protein